MVLWSNLYPLIFVCIMLSVSCRVPWTNENAVYRLQISALVPEKFKLKKMGKIYKWNDWWRHTLNPVLYEAYKWGYLGQFAVQNTETWQADSSTANTPIAIKNTITFHSHGNSLFPSPHPLNFNMLVIFSLKNVKQGHKLQPTYLYACWIMHMKSC